MEEDVKDEQLRCQIIERWKFKSSEKGLGMKWRKIKLETEIEEIEQVIRRKRRHREKGI